MPATCAQQMSVTIGRAGRLAAGPYLLWRLGASALTPRRHAGSCLTDPITIAPMHGFEPCHLARLPPADRSQPVCDQLPCKTGVTPVLHAPRQAGVGSG